MPQNTVVRRTLVIVLVVLGCLLAVLSLVSVWGRNQILDTDKYLASVAPLASDPAIQRDVADKISTAINDQLTESNAVENALPPRAKFLAVPINSALTGLVEDKTDEFVHSPAFAKLWVALNREGHQELVKILRGETSDAVVINGGRLGLDLGAVVEEVRARLVAQGLTVVASLPQISVVVDVADAKGLEAAQVGVKRLDLLANVLPWVSIACLLVAVLLAKRHRRAGVWAALALVWTMVLVRATLASGQAAAVASVPRRVASRPAVDAYYEHLTVLLHRGDLLTGLIAAGIAAVLLLLRTAPRTEGNPVGLRLVRSVDAEWGLAAATAAGAALLVLAAPAAAWLSYLLVIAAVVLLIRWVLARQRTPAAT